ncbi:hypothetical protein BGZ89_007783 [Linnemannia elongata]|nr:hypothetical protein BGZ89_007783 [Linnemannia elongata]
MSPSGREKVELECPLAIIPGPFQDLYWFVASNTVRSDSGDIEQYTVGETVILDSGITHTAEWWKWVDTEDNAKIKGIMSGLEAEARMKKAKKMKGKRN